VADSTGLVFFFPTPISLVVKISDYNRVFREVIRKTQHQNPEFGPKSGEIQKKACNKIH
jgi:hypothetical protein